MSRSFFKEIMLAVLLCLGASRLWADAAAEQTATAPRTAVQTPKSSQATGAISLADYQARLASLIDLVADCRHAMTPAVCAGDKVGPDVMVSLPSGPRQVSFGWLHTLLDRAAHPATVQAAQAVPNAAKGDTAKSKSPSNNSSAAAAIFVQLDAATKRLSDDQRAVAAQSANGLQGQSAGSLAEHKTLDHILEAKEYNTAITGKTIKDRILEKIANWIDSVVGGLIRAGSKSKWFGVTAEFGFIALLCIGLVWLMIRLERQARFGSPMIRPDGGTGAASARDWRLWAEDARLAASKSAWREAIHFNYWSSISRLESSGLWPADRARTPREYLAMLPAEGRQHPDLLALTRSFERTWYAGQRAEESDFRRAQALAESLGAALSRGLRRGPTSE